jgi:hypothetical protein
LARSRAGDGVAVTHPEGEAADFSVERDGEAADRV